MNNLENTGKHIARTDFFEGGEVKRQEIATANSDCGCVCGCGCGCPSSCPCSTVCQPNCDCGFGPDNASAGLLAGTILASYMTAGGGVTNTAVNAVTTPNYNANRNADISAQSNAG